MADNTVIFLAGGKGKGKSTLAREIIRAHKRVVIFDAHGEYGPDAEDKLRGCQVAWEIGPSVDLMLEKARLPLAKPFCISLRVVDDVEALQLFDMAYTIPNSLLVVEEASRFCSPTKLPREVARIVRFGRHQQISQLWIARRPAEINRDVTANADVIVAFRQHEPRDVLYLKAIAGERAELLRHLSDYRVMAFGDERKIPLAVAKRVEVPRVKHPNQMTLDMGKPSI